MSYRITISRHGKEGYVRCWTNVPQVPMSLEAGAIGFTTIESKYVIINGSWLVLIEEE